MLCKEIFWLNLGIMKNILNLAEFKMGKNTDEYKYFKKEIMSFFYDGLLSKYLEDYEKGKVKRCSCKASLRKGYKDCKCGGSGYTENN